MKNYYPITTNIQKKYVCLCESTRVFLCAFMCRREIEGERESIYVIQNFVWRIEREPIAL